MAARARYGYWRTVERIDNAHRQFHVACVRSRRIWTQDRILGEDDLDGLQAPVVQRNVVVAQTDLILVLHG